MANARRYSFAVADREILTWPDHIAIEIFNSQPVMGLVRFDDIAVYHPRLIDHIMDLETDAELTTSLEGGANRVEDLQDWDIVEADLINARALKLCNSLLHSDRGRIISAYGLILRDGACLPPRNPDDAVASVTYLLDAGEPDAGNGNNGRLSFTHRELEDWTADGPEGMTPGVMMAYPAAMLAAVQPYSGQHPRILLNWYIAL